jgi:glyoxylase-like metal-dependent hydrolase (beta-lactamase superfamily II)
LTPRLIPLLASVVIGLPATRVVAGTWCDAPPAAGLEALQANDDGDDWFTVQVAAPGVYAISEPRQYEGVTSFLIVGSGRAVLFDSGLGVAPISEVVQKLTALPVTVINSHTHFDHVGGNREFADVRNLDEAFSRASARGEVSDALRAYASATLAEDRVCGPLPVGVTSRVYEMPTWRASAQVRDGEVLDLGGRRLEILRTPGHTPDSLSLLDRANGLLFTGDTYYSGEIYLWSPETDVASYTTSINTLASLEPGLKALLPAHGPAVAEPRRLIELQEALQDIRSGEASFEPADAGRRHYRFEHFSILAAGSDDGDPP